MRDPDLKDLINLCSYDMLANFMLLHYEVLAWVIDAKPPRGVPIHLTEMVRI